MSNLLSIFSLPYVSRRRKTILMFFITWLVWIFMERFLGTYDLMDNILKGFIFSVILTFISSVVLNEGFDVYKKLDQEENIKNRLRKLGYRLHQECGDTSTYKISGSSRLQNVQLKKTTFYIRLKLPELLLPEFTELK